MSVRYLFTTCLLAAFLAGLGIAQTQGPPKPPAAQEKKPVKDPKDPDAEPQTDPNNPDASAPADPNGLLPDKSSPATDYTGPSVLSRGFSLATPTLPRQEKFRPFLGVNAIYDSGLAGAVVSTTGKVNTAASEGADVNFGLTGRHIWRRDILQVDYRGHQYFYSGNTQSRGQDHALNASVSHYFNSRIVVSLRENAGVYSNTFSVLNSVSNTDVSINNMGLPVTPNTESFDDRSFYTSTQADAAYQKSARLSFNFGASYFTVQRHSNALANSHGFQAHNDATYRMSRRSTVGAYYAFTNYGFARFFGDANGHTIGGIYSYAFNKSTELRLRGGGTRLETLGLRTVIIDPFVAAVLGQAVGVQKAYSVTYIPDFTGELSKSLAHSAIGLTVGIGISSGNGLYQTSRRQSESLYYNYNGIRKYAFGFSAGRDTLSALSNVVGTYNSNFGRVNVTRVLPRSMQVNLTAEYRVLSFTTGYSRREFRLSTGFLYSPGEGPLKFW